MSLVKKGKQAYRAMARALVSAWKVLLRLLTKQGELERALRKAIAEDQGWRSADLVKAVATSLARSSQLAELKVCVLGGKVFSASAASAKIAEQKGITDEEVVTALTWCLQVLSMVSAVIERVGELQRQSYDADDAAHVALLESLWESLKPNTRRTDWGELGFQNGSVPQSDFRGMGMLGLHQLVFFAQQRNQEAIRILEDSTDPKRYFPFAAAGINITAFTTTMLEQRRLDARMYDAIAKYMPADIVPDSGLDMEVLVEAGLAAFNEFYGEEYVEFSRFWHASLPESTMAFPGIFGTIKERSNSRFPRLVEGDE